MKRIFLSFFVLFISHNVYSQTMYSFFSNEGNKLLATLAHPTNTFKYAKYRVENNSVWVDIYYEDFNTELRIKRTGDFFTKIEVIYDNDWVSPFTAIGQIKDVVLKFSEDNSDTQTKNEFERKINKVISEMNGKELTCLILTLAWIDY